MSSPRSCWSRMRAPDFIELAKINGADLSDDALIYAGSATVTRWQNWVPFGVIGVWRDLSEGERALVYMVAQAAANMAARGKR